MNHGGAAESYFARRLLKLPSVGAQTKLSSLPYYACGGSIQLNWCDCRDGKQSWSLSMFICVISQINGKNSLVGMIMYNCIILV